MHACIHTLTIISTYIHQILLLYYNNGIRSQQEDIFYPLYTKLFFNYDIDPSIYLSARQRPNVSLYQS